METYAMIKCLCGNSYSFEDFSKHVRDMKDREVVETHDWLERQVRITQHQMDVRGIESGEKYE